MIPWTMPAPPHRSAARDGLRKALKSKTIDEVVEERVEKVYSLDGVEHPAVRRMYDTSAQVYSRDELEQATRAGLMALLTEGDSDAR